MFFSFLFIRLPPFSTLFPYTTLFRSIGERAPPVVAVHVADVEVLVVPASLDDPAGGDRKSTRLNSSHVAISYAVFCLKKKKFATIIMTSVYTPFSCFHGIVS